MVPSALLGPLRGQAVAPGTDCDSLMNGGNTSFTRIHEHPPTVVLLFSRIWFINERWGDACNSLSVSDRSVELICRHRTLAQPRQNLPPDGYKSCRRWSVPISGSESSVHRRSPLQLNHYGLETDAFVLPSISRLKKAKILY